MPAVWLLHVLEERLAREFGDACEVLPTSLTDLTAEERTAAVDALVYRHGTLPITLVDGAVACTDSIDLDAIAAAVAARL